METPQPPQVSVSGSIIIEGHLTAPSSPRLEIAPAAVPPPRWKFWQRWKDFHKITAYATLLLASGTFVLAVFSLLQWIASAALVATARETEERQLQAYVGITGRVSLRCLSCDAATYAPFSPTPKHALDNSISFDVKNSGQTPAYKLAIKIAYFPVPSGQGLPKNFAYEFVPPTETEIVGSFAPGITNPTATVNPGEKFPVEVALPSATIAQMRKTQHHETTLYYFGSITYNVIFRKTVIIPFCLQYLPDNAEGLQFANCEEHNTPDYGK
jgi:hypothetical protein